MAETFTFDEAASPALSDGQGFSFEEAAAAGKDASGPSGDGFSFEEATGDPARAAKRAELEKEMAEARVEGRMAGAEVTAADLVGRAAGVVSQMRPDIIFKRILGLPYEIDRALGWVPQDSANPMEQPLLTPEHIESLQHAARNLSKGESPYADTTEPARAPWEQGVVDFENQMASGLTAPDALAAMAIGAKVPGAGPAVARGFQTQMVGELPAAIENYAEARKSGDTRKTVAAALNVAAGLGLPALLEYGISKGDGARAESSNSGGQTSTEGEAAAETEPTVQTSGPGEGFTFEEAKAPAVEVPAAGAEAAVEVPASAETPPPSGEAGVENVRPGANGEAVLEPNGEKLGGTGEVPSGAENPPLPSSKVIRVAGAEYDAAQAAQRVSYLDGRIQEELAKRPADHRAIENLIDEADALRGAFGLGSEPRKVFSMSTAGAPAAARAGGLPKTTPAKPSPPLPPAKPRPVPLPPGPLPPRVPAGVPGFFTRMRQSFQSVFSPQNIDPTAKRFSHIIRQYNGQAALDLVRADEHLGEMRGISTRRRWRRIGLTIRRRRCRIISR
jgi:hypothetical protein